MHNTIRMPDALRPYYEEELSSYRREFKENRLQASWRYLERAHILAQPFAYEHTAVHWQMLCFGVRIKSLREVLGQIPRLLFGGVKSFVGKVPIGNTGGANVSPLKPMAIPDDLLQIINHSRIRE